MVFDLAISAQKYLKIVMQKKQLYMRSSTLSIVSIVSIVPTKGPNTKFVEGVAISDLIKV